MRGRLLARLKEGGLAITATGRADWPVVASPTTCGGFTLRERAFLAWFGVRGVGSQYYVSAALAAGILSGGESETLF